MADFERKLISLLAHGASLDNCFDAGIDESHFLAEDARDIYKFIKEHTVKYNKQPSFETIREKFPNRGFETVVDAQSYVIERFLGEVKRRVVIDKLRDLGNRTTDVDSLPVLDDLFLEYAREVSQLVPNASVKSFKDMPDRVEAYKASAKDGNKVGVRTGYPSIDSLTFGFQPHEMATISGWSGKGKSTLLQTFLFNTYTLQGKTPMLFSLEMEAEALLRRWDAMAANLEYRAMRAKELDDKDIERWEKRAAKAKKASNDIIVLDHVGKCTVDKIYSNMNRYKPDIVGIDYLSLMETPRGASGAMWEKLTYLTQHLKMIARSLKIPIVAVAQTNREGANDDGAELSNVAYSVSIIQDSDIVFGLRQNDEMFEQHQLEVKILKNRDGALKNIPMYWNPEKMEFREWNVTDDFPVRQEVSGNGKVVSTNGKKAHLEVIK